MQQSTKVDIKTNRAVYKKHHSFEGFSSSVGSDPEFQKQRVLRILLSTKASTLSSAHQEIIKAVITDLTSQGLKEVDFKVTVHISDELSKLEDSEVLRYVIHRYRYDVFPKKKKLDQFPPYLQIEPTSICNFRCVFCYQTDKSFSDKSSGFMGSMTLDLFKEVIDQIQGNVEFISIASRGEPMVCKDIDAMLKYAVGKFLGLKVNTNASLLNEAHCHAILSGGVNTIVFSADAAEEPLYSQLRVGGKLDKVLANIEMFKKIKEKHYSKSKIITRVSGVKVSDQQAMPLMKETWGPLVDQLAFVAYNPWENVYESPINDIKTPCSDLWRRMFVWHDGLTNPCDTDFKSTLSPGTIKDKSISKIWLSDQYMALREKHLKDTRSQKDPCRRCTVI